MKFKSGDRVKCINNIATDLDLNNIYIVEKMDSNGFVYIFDGNNHYGYAPNRFELSYIQEFKNKLDNILEE